MKIDRNMCTGVLMGGMSHEHEISLKSGEAVFHSLMRQGYNVKRIYVDRDVDQILRQSPIDVAFIALHGLHGEDGCIQGLLETLGIPYTGSKVLASSLAFDKIKSKELFHLHNIPTPTYYAFTKSCLPIDREFHKLFDFPCFVKPARSGSSIGAGLARDVGELNMYCRQALQIDSSILIEKWIEGREIAVALFDDKPIGVLEIKPKGCFFDYKSKYQKGQSTYCVPTAFTESRYRGIVNVAKSAVRCLGVQGASRVDMIVTEDANEYVLEVNTLPGMTETSLYPMIAKRAGYGFDELCNMMLEHASLGSSLSSYSSFRESSCAVSSDKTISLKDDSAHPHPVTLVEHPASSEM